MKKLLIESRTSRLKKAGLVALKKSDFKRA